MGRKEALPTFPISPSHPPNSFMSASGVYLVAAGRAGWWPNIILFSSIFSVTQRMPNLPMRPSGRAWLLWMNESSEQVYRVQLLANVMTWSLR